MGGVLHELDLTEEQRDQIRTTVHQRMGGELGEAMRQSRDARRELEELIADPVAEEAAIRDALQRVGRATERLALERHGLTVAVGEILTAEQREQYRELLAERPQRAPRRRPGGPPWGD
jgi:Spy/CpxP family protein refolding chaperone